MGDVLPFRKVKQKRKGNTLCRQGHHKWQIVQEKQFDVKSGKLVTLLRCCYCQQRKTKYL